MAQLKIQLHPAQAAIWNSKARFKVIAAGRRFGKSHLASVALGVAALSETNVRGHKLTSQQPCYYVGPTFEQSLRMMRPKLINLLGWEREGGFITNENQNGGWLELLNGCKIYIRGAENDDALRGEGNRIVIIDEYADIAPHVWTEILEPTLMDVEGEAMFIGTPKGKNHFYRLFMNALTHPEPYWDDWEAFHFKSGDNPFIKERELKRIASRMQSSDGLDPRDTVRQEIDADFISGGSKILKPDWFPVVHGYDGLGGQTFVTVDLAGFRKAENREILKSDESVIAVTHVNRDMWTVLRIWHGHWDVRECASRIVLTMRDYPGARLGIEEGALKAAVEPYLEDYMRQYNRYTNIEPLKHHNARKQDRIDWALAGRGKRGLVQLLTDTPEGEGSRTVERWNNWFLDQVADFPDPLAHDDGLDAVAYVDQMSTASYVDVEDISEWQALDPVSGY